MYIEYERETAHSESGGNEPWDSYLIVFKGSRKL